MCYNQNIRLNALSTYTWLTWDGDNMLTEKERIWVLEKKVAQLERELKALRKSDNIALNDPKAELLKPAIEDANLSPKSPKKQPASKSFSVSGVKEVMIGKYLIGALAALLLFVGAGSFIVMIWDKITPEIKLSAVSIVGVLLTVAGFLRIKKDKGSIASIMLGSGCGVTYISILSARMAFGFIDNNTTILLCTIWALTFIISSLYTDLFFTTIIAYVGSIIALSLGLQLAVSDLDILMLTAFVTTISIVMLFIVRKRNTMELLVCALLVIVNYGVLHFFAFFSLMSFFGEKNTNYLIYGIEIFALLVVYCLMNVCSYITRNNPQIVISVLASIMVTILTIQFAFSTVSILDISTTQAYFIFLLGHLIQFVSNGIFFKDVDKYLEIYYPIVIGLTIALINLDSFSILAGISITALLLIAKNKIIGKALPVKTVSTIALIDTLLLMSAISDSAKTYIITAYGILNVGIMAYLLLSKHLPTVQMGRTKIKAMIVFLLHCFILPLTLFPIFFKNYEQSQLWGTAIGYALAVLLVTGAHRFNYFTSNDNADEPQKQSKGLFSALSDIKKFFVLVSGCLYLFGILKILLLDNQAIVYVYFLSALAVIVHHTQLLFSNKTGDYNDFSAVIFSEHLILAWSMLYSYGYSAGSVLYSVIGLIIAMIAILVGFKHLMKNLRRYGLILTIAMVIKFIILDLSGENSIKRVAALIAGAMLCFIISYIYNKLSARLEDNEKN